MWQLEGHQFDSWSGHMPGLQARFPVGGLQEAPSLFNVSLLLFLPPFSSLKYNKIFKNKKIALAGVAQWIEYQPVSQRVTGLIPGQGTGLG